MAEILLVEDADRIASFVVKGLQAHGLSVTHAKTGEDALQLLRAANFDLVILDIGLPGIDGFEVLEQLRGSGDETPVIVLTARDSVDNTVASFEGGADDYIGKPFAFEELLVRVRSRLRRQPSHQAAGIELVAGEVLLSLSTRTVRVGQDTHELTAREFVMLEYLMQNSNQVISREQLLSRVWGFDHDPGSNVVDVYIRYLRQKLGAERIQTVRGAGYKFVG
jgi:DNA-binding response OmpR family regulator